MPGWTGVQDLVSRLTCGGLGWVVDGKPLLFVSFDVSMEGRVYEMRVYSGGTDGEEYC